MGLKPASVKGEEPPFQLPSGESENNENAHLSGVPPLRPLPDGYVLPSLLEFGLDDAEGESSSSSSSSSEEESDDDEDDVNDENAHLSKYERQRLATIKRNEARLARLGLLTTNRASSSGSMSNNENKKMPPKQVGETLCLFASSMIRFFSPQHSTAAEEEAERHRSEETPAAQTLLQQYRS